MLKTDITFHSPIEVEISPYEWNHSTKGHLQEVQRQSTKIRLAQKRRIQGYLEHGTSALRGMLF